ncbi:molybdopterin molybdotransferase MoeA [Mollicutes bacterium LVI A0039]|nr:molybdopterin molybdotransferase MoeA [Mollicutes bacterium LVI A0039]
MVNYDDALRLIDNYSFKIKTIEIDTFTSLGYTLATDVCSHINVPAFRKSAMDGYALNAENDLTASLEVIDTIYAGSNHNPKVLNGQCVKIMTGAPVPSDCDVVIVKELATEHNNLVHFTMPKTKLNANICQIGEDITAGRQLFSAGTLITPTIISSLISSGNHTVSVYQKPKILLVTTGDEVVTSASRLDYGQIYNSNLAYLKPRMQELGFTSDHIHITDTTDNLDSLFKSNFEFIITTGAISVGDRDIIRMFIKAQKPKIIFDRVNIMPGGPVVFWEYNDTPIISLAGSPFANFVTFELFARRILSHLTGDRTMIAAEKQLILNDSYCKTLKKRRFLKARIEANKVTIPATNHLASSMHEMTLCNCLINLERGEIDLKPGDIVNVLDTRRNNE